MLLSASAILSPLRRLDVALFYLANHGLSRPGLDAFFIFITEWRHFILPAAVLAAFLWFKGGVRGRFCLLALALCLGLTDGAASHGIKSLVRRARPCEALPDVRTPAGELRSFSFPSSHAANIAGAGLILGLEFPSWALPAALFALLVGLSRIYLGLHYPSDVLGGFILGSILGWLVFLASRRMEQAWQARGTKPGAPRSALASQLPSLGGKS